MGKPLKCDICPNDFTRIIQKGMWQLKILQIALKEVDDQSLAVALIYLDNYEEALESVEEVRRSLQLKIPQKPSLDLSILGRKADQLVHNDRFVVQHHGQCDRNNHSQQGLHCEEVLSLA